MNEIILVILLTISPFLELRASIPYGIVSGISLPTLLSVVILTNILIAPLIFLLLNYGIKHIRKISTINKIYESNVTKAQKKVEKYVNKYGIIGLALFIAIPLPGSGVYSGTLGAYVLGLKFKDIIIASTIGVILATIAVTAIFYSSYNLL